MTLSDWLIKQKAAQARLDLIAGELKARIKLGEVVQGADGLRATMSVRHARSVPFTEELEVFLRSIGAEGAIKQTQSAGSYSWSLPKEQLKHLTEEAKAQVDLKADTQELITRYHALKEEIKAYKVESDKLKAFIEDDFSRMDKAGSAVPKWREGTSRKYVSPADLDVLVEGGVITQEQMDRFVISRNSTLLSVTDEKRREQIEYFTARNR